jgi:hypothetical protein
MKQQVKEYSDVDWSEYLEGSFDEIEEFFAERRSTGWIGIESVGYGYDGGKEFYLYRFREETDEEYQKRLKLDENLKLNSERQKEKRRKQYEKLKKEFGE